MFLSELALESLDPVIPSTEAKKGFHSLGYLIKEAKTPVKDLLLFTTIF